MKTSIATVSINGTLKEKIIAIARAGFNGVEIFENDFLTNNLSPKEVKKIVQDQGLEITLFQPFRDFEGMPDNHRIRAFDRAKRKFDIMAELDRATIVDGALEELAKRSNSGSVNIELTNEGKTFNILLSLEHGRVWALSSLDRTKMKLEVVESYLEILIIN